MHAKSIKINRHPFMILSDIKFPITKYPRYAMIMQQIIDQQMQQHLRAMSGPTIYLKVCHGDKISYKYQ